MRRGRAPLAAVGRSQTDIFAEGKNANQVLSPVLKKQGRHSPPLFFIYLLLFSGFLLKCFVVGKDRFDIFVLDLTGNVIFCDLHDQRTQNNNTDQVGEHHHSVEGVGNVPCQRRGHHGAQHNGDQVNDLKNDSSLGAKQIFPSLAAVVRPAQNGGKGEKEHGDGDEAAADIGPAKHGVECAANQGRVRVAGQNFAGAQVISAAGQHHQSGHGANDHGVGEHLKDAPHTLLYGFFYIGVGVDHNRRTEACLVGEYAALEALGHDLADHHADTAADGCDGLESALEDSAESGQDAGVVDADDDNAAENEEDYHERNDLFRGICDALQTAQSDQSGEDHDNGAEDHIIQAETAQNFDGGKSVNGESSGYIGYDLVDLTHGADAEGCQKGKDTEEDRQDLAGDLHTLLAAQTVSQIVHGAATPLAVFVAAAVVDTQNIFGIVGHHAEESSDPHPEHGAGATDADGGCDTGDITGTDSCSQSGAKSLERRNSTLFLGMAHDLFGEHAAEGVLEPVTDAGDLEEAGSRGHQDAGADQQDQTEHAPYKAVD